MSRVLAVEGEVGAEARVDVAECASRVPREEGEKAGDVRPRVGELIFSLQAGYRARKTRKTETNVRAMDGV
jgi:hypothetical protein